MMSDKHLNPAIREATGAFCRSLLEAILPAIREVARAEGFAVAVHDSLKRDIDLVAVPWTEVAAATKPDDLARAICGAVAGVLGRCHILGGPTQKPHGRIAFTLIHAGFAGAIDLSIMPTTLESEAE